MKAITFTDFGDADVLRLDDVPDPELRPHDLLLRNHAAGVNRAGSKRGQSGPVASIQSKFIHLLLLDLGSQRIGSLIEGLRRS